MTGAARCQHDGVARWRDLPRYEEDDSGSRRPTAGAPEPNLLRYVYALAGAYHTRQGHARNLLRAGERFNSLGAGSHRLFEMRAGGSRPRAAGAQGLRALGLPAERIVPISCRPHQAALHLFDRFCFEDYPIGSIGFSYCRSASPPQPKSEIDAVHR